MHSIAVRQPYLSRNAFCWLGWHICTLKAKARQNRNMSVTEACGEYGEQGCDIRSDVWVYCIQHHGGQWSSADIPCVSNILISGYYIPHSFTTSDTADGLGAWRSIGDTVYNLAPQYTAAHNEHAWQPPPPELRNARVRVSRACVRVRILLYYYNIIILLYLYIYITILSLYCSIWLYGYMVILLYSYIVI